MNGIKLVVTWASLIVLGGALSFGAAYAVVVVGRALTGAL